MECALDGIDDGVDHDHDEAGDEACIARVDPPDPHLMLIVTLTVCVQWPVLPEEAMELSPRHDKEHGRQPS